MIKIQLTREQRDDPCVLIPLFVRNSQAANKVRAQLGSKLGRCPRLSIQVSGSTWEVRLSSSVSDLSPVDLSSHGADHQQTGRLVVACQATQQKNKKNYLSFSIQRGAALAPGDSACTKMYSECYFWISQLFHLISFLNELKIDALSCVLRCEIATFSLKLDHRIVTRRWISSFKEPFIWIKVHVFFDGNVFLTLKL